MGNCENKQNLLRQKEILQQYEWIRIIGKGGFGRVWQVRDQNCGKTLAVKKLNKAR